MSEFNPKTSKKSHRLDSFDPKDYVDHEAAWLAFRRKWLADNPPMDNGYYLCGICGHWVNHDEVSLDHIEPRTAENTFKASNIQPAHGFCNNSKGSKRWRPKVNQEQYNFLRQLSDM